MVKECRDVCRPQEIRPPHFRGLTHKKHIINMRQEAVGNELPCFYRCRLPLLPGRSSWPNCTLPRYLCKSLLPSETHFYYYMSRQIRRACFQKVSWSSYGVCTVKLRSVLQVWDTQHMKNRPYSFTGERPREGHTTAWINYVMIVSIHSQL